MGPPIDGNTHISLAGGVTVFGTISVFPVDDIPWMLEIGVAYSTGAEDYLAVQSAQNNGRVFQD